MTRKGQASASRLSKSFGSVSKGAGGRDVPGALPRNGRDSRDRRPLAETASLSYIEIRFELLLTIVQIAFAFAQTYNVYHFSWLYNTNWIAMAFLCLLLSRRLLQALLLAPLPLPAPPPVQRHRSAKATQAAHAAYTAQVAAMRRWKIVAITLAILGATWLMSHVLLVVSAGQLLHMLVPWLLQSVLMDWKLNNDIHEKKEAEHADAEGAEDDQGGKASSRPESELRRPLSRKGGGSSSGVGGGHSGGGRASGGDGGSDTNRGSGAGQDVNGINDRMLASLKSSPTRGLLRGWPKAVSEGIIMAYIATILPMRLTPHDEFFFYPLDCAAVSASCAITCALLLRTWAVASSTYPFVPLCSDTSLRRISENILQALQRANSDFELPASNQNRYNLMAAIVVGEASVLLANGLLAFWRRHWPPYLVGCVCAELVLLVVAQPLFAYRGRYKTDMKHAKISAKVDAMIVTTTQASPRDE